MARSYVETCVTAQAMIAGLPYRIVLTFGSATAVLIERVPRAATVRDEIAATALRQATGRADISIGRRPSGRPKLEPPYYELGVSLAAREGLLLAGFAPGQNVGVDLEVDGTAVGGDPAGLARDHFAWCEADAISRLGRAEASDLFLRFWVAKEAVLKATGRGIVDGLQWPDLGHVSEQLRAGEPIRLKQPHGTALGILIKKLDFGASNPVYCALAVIDPIANRQSSVM